MESMKGYGFAYIIHMMFMEVLADTILKIVGIMTTIFMQK